MRGGYGFEEVLLGPDHGFGSRGHDPETVADVFDLRAFEVQLVDAHFGKRTQSALVQVHVVEVWGVPEIPDLVDLLVRVVLVLADHAAVVHPVLPHPLVRVVLRFLPEPEALVVGAF